MRTGAAKLMSRVVVKRVSEDATRDSGGQIDQADEDNWRTVCERWCEILPRGSREFQRASQVGEEITHLVRFRYDQESKKFKTTWKIVEKTKENPNRTLNLAGSGYDENGEHKYLLFPAIEVEAQT